ncbi:hypothetical protein B0F90DRAFT_525302 [Multifurca ochricompacta]|uniref:RING-type domain-containing protein n=1 Tax=Multifurca ochricompacta TaxID=376703 RepID=A0AAD4QSX1_9AGAM|nr:hypothetical protein B0F90DRAFT_525302 [Multifurca ochricompacta]
MRPTETGRPSWDPFDPDVLRNEEDSTSHLTDDQIKNIIEDLPHLTEADLEHLGHRDSSCSICLNTFLASLAEEEMAQAIDSPAQPPELLGVTHLSNSCGHVFCRKDLLTWIRDGNRSCPLCRTLLIKPADSASTNAARRRIIAAYRLESRILNGSSLGSADMLYREDEEGLEHSGMYS